jgi:hypothetical protein
MIKIPFWLTLPALCVLGSGCVPVHFTIQPGLSGKVVSAADWQPISDATISIGTNAAPDAISAADGTLKISPEKKWGVLILLPQDPFVLMVGLSVSVRHNGYETRQMGFTREECNKSGKKPVFIVLEPTK